MNTSPEYGTVWRHSKYWLEESNTVILRVEDTLYRIDPAFLKKASEFWESLFTLPSPRNTAEGSVGVSSNVSVKNSRSNSTQEG
ncbi:hypothetical protein QCA50_018044 [Cerrena zonata]|uniref:Uncharacterized protein n=1 Tax=Cerrena zonata TaxID=2478898 RepID=A0AAW0FIW7_9APHY